MFRVWVVYIACTPHTQVDCNVANCTGNDTKIVLINNMNINMGSLLKNKCGGFCICCVSVRVSSLVHELGL